ncbi:MAG TPA: polysaccharide biosynthesis tyrosine autokinase [Flavisolibacter sp.]|nr:polysaccharide biosynthesis tyrosine autokinase [Flavisolibacter sp.]
MQINKKNSETKETNLVSSLLFRFLPYWPLFILLMLLCLTGAWLYLRYATPMYEADATVLIKDEKKGADESNMQEALNIPLGKKIVENETEVLRSRKLVNEVVNKLRLYAQVFEEKNPKPVPAYTTSPVIIQAANPEALVEADKVYFSLKKGESVIINNKAYPLNRWVSTPYGELKFEANPALTNKETRLLFFQLYNPQQITSSILANLKVESAGKLSTVVNLSLRDQVPARAEDVLNELIAAYNQSSIDDQNKLAINTLSFIDNRLKTIEKELDSIEGHIQKYRSDKGVVDLGEQGKHFLESVGDNDRKLSEVNIQLAVLDQVEHYLNSNSQENGPAIIPSSLGLTDPTLNQLMERLYQAEIEYQKLRTTTGGKNPLIEPVLNEIGELRPRILENVRSQRTNLLVSKNNLASTNSGYNSVLNSLPQRERELTEISRQHTVKNSVYSFLLEKREQTAMSISSTTADLKVVDGAVSSTDPVSPKKPFAYMIAIFAALGLSIGGVSARELLSNKVLFRSDIESITKVPVAAEIVNTKKKESLINTSSKVSFAAEQFRQLRTAIGLNHIPLQDSKKILVTSSIAGEGKSYICSNLAISLALATKKVVVVDLDIRSPKLSSMFNVSGKPGLAEFLEGKKGLDDIVCTTNYPNLYVIGAGNGAEDLRDLLLSSKLNDLLSRLATQFDYVIMDTAPIEPVTDAHVLSKYCDITLLIVRHSYTPKSIVQLLDNKNLQLLKNPYIVFNAVRPRGIFKGKYGYGYGYGYQSVYHEKKAKAKKKEFQHLEIQN